MKKLKLSIMLLIMVILCMIPSYAQTTEPADLQTLNKIQQEHSNTRKFFSDELARQRNEFFKQTDDRADYYEKTVDNMLTTAVWKLALLWGGIMFFFLSFNHLIRNNLEKKRFKKFKESIKGEVMRDIMNFNVGEKQQTAKQQTVKQPILKSKKGFDVEVDELFHSQNNITTPQPQQPLPPKKGFFQRRKEKKLQKQILKNQKEQEKLRKMLGLLTPQQQPPQQQPLQPQSQAQPQQPNIQYDNSFEVEY